MTIVATLLLAAILEAVPAGAAPRRASRPTVVVGLPAVPRVLNPLTPAGYTAATQAAVLPALARGYRVTPDLRYEPWLFDRDCEEVSRSPFTVRCSVRADARWSDGTPLTAADFAFTYRTIMDPRTAVVSRAGFDRILSFRVVSPTVLEMTFREVYGPFRDLWATATPVLPKHLLAGRRLDTVWRACVCDPRTGRPVGSGPMLVRSFDPGSEVVLEPNPRYWDRPRATVRVVLRAAGTPGEQVDALRRGRLDVVAPTGRRGLAAALGRVRDVAVQVVPSLRWEHLDLLTSRPGLGDLAVRQAIATALPRRAVARLVDAGVLDNTQWTERQPPYRPNWSTYPAAGDPAAARAILDAAGWVAGRGGVRAKGGVRLRVALGTVAGDPVRRAAATTVARALRSIGIRVRVLATPGFVTHRVPAFDYDLALYSWTAGPDPAAAAPIWLSTAVPTPCRRGSRCTEPGQNYTRVRDPEVDGLLNAAQRETDGPRRALLYDRVDRLLAERGVATVPLFQWPALLAGRARVRGLAAHPGNEGPTWNVEQWTVR